MPDATGLPPLVGATPGAVSGLLPAARPAPVTDGDPGAGYPPLAAPPGPPDGADPGLDQRFERGMWWLVGSAVLAALLFAGTGFLAGPAWAEMPTGRVLLAADGDDVTAVLAGTAVRLSSGDERYLPAGSRVEVGAGSTARMTFRGGGAAVFCAGSAGAVSRLSTGGSDLVPRATLVVDSGRLLADTTGTSGAFAPLALTVSRAAGEVRNVGRARYTVETSTVAVAAGAVQAAGAPVAPAGPEPRCGAAAPAAPPVTEAPAESPTEEPTLEDPSLDPTEPTPSESESATEAPEESTTVEPTRTRDRDDDPEPERTTRRPRPVDPPNRPDPTRPIPRPTTPSPKPTTNKPTVKPTAKPTVKPTVKPTEEPTGEPTGEPTTTAPTAASGPVGTGPTASAATAALDPTPRIRG
jgi:putative peptide zinc metalloprotease protein